MTKLEEASSLASETVSIQVVVLETASLIPLATGIPTKKPAASPKSDQSIVFLLELSEAFQKLLLKII